MGFAALLLYVNDVCRSGDAVFTSRFKASETATIIPDIVDDTIFHLLDAIDNGLLSLAYTGSTGDAMVWGG